MGARRAPTQEELLSLAIRDILEVYRREDTAIEDVAINSPVESDPVTGVFGYRPQTTISITFEAQPGRT